MNAVLALITLPRVVFSAIAASPQPRDGLATLGPLPPPSPWPCLAHLYICKAWQYVALVRSILNPVTVYPRLRSTIYRYLPKAIVPALDSARPASTAHPWSAPGISQSLPRPPRWAMLSVPGPKRIFLLPELSDNGPPTMEETSMNTVVSVLLAFALMLAAVPALAGDSFQASHTIGKQTSLTPLSDEQLAAIKGAEGLFVQMAPLLSSLPGSVDLLLANLLEQATAGQVGTVSIQSTSNTEQGTGTASQTNVTEVWQQP